MRCTCVFFCCCFLHGFNPNVASMVDWAFKYIKLPTTATWVSCLCVDRIHPKEMSVKGFPFFLAIAIYCYEVSPRTVACKFSFTWWIHPYSSCSFLLSDAHSAKSLTHLHCWVIWDCWSLSILHSLCSHVILHEWLALYSAFLNIHCTEVVYLQHWHGWCHMKLLPSRHVLCTPYNHRPCHFMQSPISPVHACLAVTCHLHFWQNDQDFYVLLQ